VAVVWILKGGQIYDGSGSPPFCGDVRISGGKITHVGSSIPVADNESVIDVSGLIVAPGLIDLHVHVYDGMALHSVAPADAGLRTGVTTLLDTGSAGAMNYGSFEKYIVAPAVETIYTLLNISQFGVQGHPEILPFIGDLHDIEHLDVRPALRCIEAHPDRIIGVKARLTAALADNREQNERAALTHAIHVARKTGLLCYVHHVASSIPIEDVLKEFKAGDVLTHIYHGHGDGGFDLSRDGAPRRAMIEARDRGVIFDVGHGSGSFAWSVAEPACQQHGFWPDTISSDIHKFNIDTPVHDLPTTMSKFLHMGMALERVIQCTTSNAAAAMRQQHHLGRLAPDRQADITVLQLVEGKHTLVDSEGIKRIASHRLLPVCVFRNGRRFDCHVDYAADLSTARRELTVVSNVD
jgi:dihydroorotase